MVLISGKLRGAAGHRMTDVREAHLVELVDDVRARPVGAATVGAAHQAPGPAPPGVLGDPGRPATAASCSSSAPRPRPGSRAAGPTPAAATRPRASRSADAAAVRLREELGATPVAADRDSACTCTAPTTRPPAGSSTNTIMCCSGSVPADLDLDPDPAEVARRRWVSRSRSSGGRSRSEPERYAPWLGRGGCACSRAHARRSHDLTTYGSPRVKLGLARRRPSRMLCKPPAGPDECIRPTRSRACAMMAEPPSSSSGLGRRPFKAVARVRIPLGARCGAL